MKNLVVTLLLVTLAIAFDSLAGHRGLPIVTMDLLLIPLCIAVCWQVCTPKYLSGANLNPQLAQNKSLLSTLALVMACIFFVLLGAFALYLGASEPFRLLTGIKGSCHGYTAFTIGVCILLLVFTTSYAYWFRQR
ncbi:hypothetical protein [Aliagarivorans taiwanensis]|uniref:hypothetical protein n=1 Tax=Aliagarivorans taiwanensis TaxID=561966 RepID=UPI00047BE4F8|nr:hypothetical protein [Aliagarivorans taiwanensis]